MIDGIIIKFIWRIIIFMFRLLRRGCVGVPAGHQARRPGRRLHGAHAHVYVIEVSII